MTVIKLKVEGSVKTVEFVGIDFGRAGVWAVSDIVMGEFAGDETEINYEVVPMTRKQYDNIQAFLDEEVVYDADTDIVFPETNAQLKADINAQGNSIVAILGTNAEYEERIAALEAGWGELTLRLATAEAKVAKLEAQNPIPITFNNWVVKGQELRLNVGGTGGDDCIIPVTNGFGGLCPSRIPGQPLNSQERIVTIEVNGAKHLLHVFSRGDTGRIADAVAANSDEIVTGTPAPEPTEGE